MDMSEGEGEGDGDVAVEGVEAREEDATGVVDAADEAGEKPRE